MAIHESDVEVEGDFHHLLEDEYMFDARFPPGVEIGSEEASEEDDGPLQLQPDHGSGSMAERSAHGGDGRLEVAEDKVTMASDTEMGYSIAGREKSEIGADDVVEQANSVAPFESFMMDPIRIGSRAAHFGRYGMEDIGSRAAHFGRYGMEDIGYSIAGREKEEIGSAAAMYGRYGTEDIGSSAMYGPTEIGAAAAVARVVEKARDNRMPPPPMRATDVEDDYFPDDFQLTDTILGAAAVSGNSDPFPLTTAFLRRCGEGMEPRIVRVDTEESYKAFRTEHSPEMAELSERVARVSDRLEDHIADPEAHGGEEHGDLADDIDDLVMLGGEVADAEKHKRVELWMPKRFDGSVEAWREGDMVCASLALPEHNGEVRICTSLEPVRKCVEEMSQHAATAGVGPEVVGVLPAMGCVLGAGTALKEMAAAAPSIVKKAEAEKGRPFVVRIEPKTNPTLCALALLAMACRSGDAGACKEWKMLSELCPGPVKQAMVEALALAKASE